MEINEMIEPEEWEDLPLNPEEAFARIIQLARPRFKERAAAVSHDDELLEEARYGYMASLLSVARSLDVHPFNSRAMMTPSQFNRVKFREFEAEIVSFLALAQANTAKRNRINAVEVSPRTKIGIISAVQKLRQQIAAADMPEWRRKNLLKRLDELERELARGRVDLPKVALMVATVITIPGGIAQSAEWGQEFWTNVMLPLAEEKVHQDPHKLSLGTSVPVRRIEDHSDPRMLPSPTKKSVSD